MVPTRILIAGEGGQGIQSLAKIMVEAYFSTGKKVLFLPNFGVEQRGGVSLAYVQISERPIDFPKFEKADIIVLFTERAIKRIEEYILPETVLIFDNSLVTESKVSEIKAEKVAIPASNLAKQKLIPRVFNIILLGALIAEVGGVKDKIFEKALLKHFVEKIEKEPELAHFNLRAFEIGFDVVKSLKRKTKWQKILKV